MTTLPVANLPGGIDDAGPPALICTRCGAANDLIIEAIEATIPAVPGHVCLEYSCLSCDSFYGHNASVQQVATLLNAGATTPGVLHFGHHFIHCGEPRLRPAEWWSLPRHRAGPRNARYYLDGLAVSSSRIIKPYLPSGSTRCASLLFSVDQQVKPYLGRHFQAVRPGKHAYKGLHMPPTTLKGDACRRDCEIDRQDGAGYMLKPGFAACPGRVSGPAASPWIGV